MKVKDQHNKGDFKQVTDKPTGETIKATKWRNLAIETE